MVRIQSLLKDDQNTLPRLMRAVASRASIEHAHLLPVRVARNEEGGVRLVHQASEAPTLSHLLARGPLSPKNAVAIVAGVAAAVETLERHGLVPRELSPDQILVDSERGALLVDFALPPDLMARRKPGANSVYRAPEDRNGHAPAERTRTSVYSLGAVLSAALTGKPPPGAPSPRRDLPAAFEPVITRAMASEPNERYANVIEMGRAAVAALGSSTAEHPPPQTARKRGPAAPRSSQRAKHGATRRNGHAAELDHVTRRSAHTGLPPDDAQHEDDSDEARREQATADAQREAAADQRKREAAEARKRKAAEDRKRRAAEERKRQAAAERERKKAKERDRQAREAVAQKAERERREAAAAAQEAQRAEDRQRREAAAAAQKAEQAKERERREAEAAAQKAKLAEERKLKEDAERRRKAAQERQREAAEERARKAAEERARKAAEERERKKAEERDRNAGEAAAQRAKRAEERERREAAAAAEKAKRAAERERKEAAAAAQKAQQAKERERREAEAAAQKAKLAEERKRKEGVEREREAAQERQRTAAAEREREAAAERKREAAAERERKKAEERDRKAGEAAAQRAQRAEERKRKEAAAAAQKAQRAEERERREAAAAAQKAEQAKERQRRKAEAAAQKAELAKERQRKKVQEAAQKAKLAEERKRKEDAERKRRAAQERQRKAAAERQRKAAETAAWKRNQTDERERKAPKTAKRHRVRATGRIDPQFARRALAGGKRWANEHRSLAPLALVVLVTATVAGLALPRDSGEESRATAVRVGKLDIELPAGWERTKPPSGRFASITELVTGSLVARPADGADATLMAGLVRDPVTTSRRLGRLLSNGAEPAAGRLGQLDVTRYPRVRTRQGTIATVYLANTTGHSALILCEGPADAGSRSLQACAKAASTVSVRGERSVAATLQQRAGFERAALQKLATERLAARSRVAVAVVADDQAAASGSLEASYLQAAGRVELSGMYGPTTDALLRALRVAGAGYGDLATAIRQGDQDAYNAARAAVLEAETQIWGESAAN